MDIVWGTSKNPDLRNAMVEWTSRQIWPDKTHKTLPKGVCMGVFDKGEIIACMVYHDWEPDAGVIELSGAATSRRWLTRQTLKAMFDYPFIDVGVQMLVSRVSADPRQNHLKRIFTAYGFDHQIIPRLYGRNEDGILYSLTDDDWRKSKFRKERDIGQTGRT